MVIDDQETSDAAALVRHARAGDREAFGDLVEQLWPGLVALARGVLGTDADAEDVAQEALIHAWKRLWTLRRPESFVPWVRRIVTRRSLTRVRRRKPTVEPAERDGGRRSAGERPRRRRRAARDARAAAAGGPLSHLDRGLHRPRGRTPPGSQPGDRAGAPLPRPRAPAAKGGGTRMNDEELRDLRRRIRDWTNRPPTVSPRAARTRVLARLDRRRPRLPYRLAAAALMLAALAVGSHLLRPDKPAEPPAPSQGLLVYELESGTKVYLDLAARTAQGDEE